MDGGRDTGQAVITAEIVRRIRDGDREAFSDLYRRHHDALLLAVRCRLGPGLRAHLESEDILQSVVLDAFSDIGHFEPRGPNALVHWLHACVLNKIRSKAEYFAAERRAGTVPLSDDDTGRLATPGTGTPAYFDDERYGKVERAMKLLPDDMREAILLRRVEGLTIAETAAALGRNEAAAAKLFSRAMARLHLLLGGWKEGV